MTTRVVGHCHLGPDWSALTGMFFDVPFETDPCPTTLDRIPFHWTKEDAALSSGQPTIVDDVRAMLQGKLDAAESCEALRSVHYFDLSLGLDGATVVASSVSAWLDSVEVAGVQRQSWARWSVQRSAFSSGERDDLDAVVALLIAHLEVEEPV